jgi:hypothetical protein
MKLKPARDRNAQVISFVKQIDQLTLLNLVLTQVSILSLELLKIHVIPVELESEVADVTSKAEAFP